MGTHSYPLVVDVTLVCTEAGRAAIERYVNLDEAGGREMATTPGLTREQVEVDLMGALLRTGVAAHQLDGWADLEDGDIILHIDHVALL